MLAELTRETGRLRAMVPRRRRARRPVKARRRPLTFREFVERANPRFRWYRHCVALADVLQRVADDEIRRVMVWEPPRHGKSEEVSRLFPAYYLYRHPRRFIGLASYAAGLANTLSRAARENYRRMGGRLQGSARAVKQWETERGGGLWACGVGGEATGKGFHLGIIDDPIKNQEEAASEVIRERNKDWYKSVFYTRAEPDAAIIVVQTRWHEDDLTGWLLEEEKGDEPERWHVVNLQALRELDAPELPSTCTVEPDWRDEGEPLCPERYPLARLKAISRRLGEYFWSALYQQRPAPREGIMFRRGLFATVAAPPAGAQFVRYWDKAGTDDAGAYTAGVLMAEFGGAFYVVDVVRGQWSATERNAIIRQTATDDAARYGNERVAIWFEQEPGSGGKESAEISVRELAGYNARKEPVTGDKIARAYPLAAQAGVRNVSLVEGAWNAAYLTELAAFPTGRYKDQVDASSGAFNKLALNLGGPVVGSEAAGVLVGAA